jgi:hypothetical protein
MLAAYNKTIVAAVMGVAQIANVLGFHWGVDEHTVTIAVAALTAFGVYFFPNKP